MLNRKAVEARLIEKARLEPTFRKNLVADPSRAISEELGVEIPSGLKLKVVVETDRELFLVLPRATPISDLEPRKAGAVVGGVQSRREEAAEKHSETDSKVRTVFEGWLEG